jgi:hypothetical protein
LPGSGRTSRIITSPALATRSKVWRRSTSARAASPSPPRCCAISSPARVS